MFTAALVANTMATIAAIKGAAYAIRTVELAEIQLIETKHRLAGKKKRKLGADKTKNDGVNAIATATKISNNGSGKKPKLTPVHASSIAQPTNRGSDSGTSERSDSGEGVAMTSTSSAGPIKRLKLLPVTVCTTSNITYSSPTVTTVTETAIHTLSAGRGSKHGRDYALADRKGKKGKR